MARARSRRTSNLSSGGIHTPAEGGTETGTPRDDSGSSPTDGGPKPNLDIVGQNPWSLEAWIKPNFESDKVFHEYLNKRQNGNNGIVAYVRHENNGTNVQVEQSYVGTRWRSTIMRSQTIASWPISRRGSSRSCKSRTTVPNLWYIRTVS